MTQQVQQTILQSDCIIGAKRMLQAVAVPGQKQYEAIDPGHIADYILSHREYQHFAVVMSGDTAFFSGAKKLLPLLDFCNVEVLPGISSLSYFCARLKTSYEDICVASLHGRAHNIVSAVRSHSRVFALVGGANGMQELCRTLVSAELGHVQVRIGERLSYPDEKITTGTAAQLSNGTYAPLSVALIENDCADASVAYGLPDHSFLRNSGPDGIVPMTKSEVRAVCLSKLRLTERSVCWDVGAGTGSVATEMALQCKKGAVYAIERNSAAIELLRQNKKAFSAENLTIISGCAPEVCLKLPAPSHAFIGGSSGNLREILSLLLKKNPSIRIVATAVSLETAAELTACMKAFPWKETDVLSMQIAHGRKAGSYHLMTGQNPIYIFTMQAGGNNT